MLAFFASLFLIGAQDPALLESFEVQGFNTTITVEIDAPRDVVFEAATGDVTGWWDHSFWPDPAEMVIEILVFLNLNGMLLIRWRDFSSNS